jgi:hypothetical protein
LAEPGLDGAHDTKDRVQSRKRASRGHLDCPDDEDDEGRKDDSVLIVWMTRKGRKKRKPEATPGGSHGRYLIVRFDSGKSNWQSLTQGAVTGVWGWGAGGFESFGVLKRV